MLSVTLTSAGQHWPCIHKDHRKASTATVGRASELVGYVLVACTSSQVPETEREPFNLYVATIHLHVTYP